ncbi:MAG: PEP-CTERM sorting domain-containing protein [Verrucomicrobiae bacterium]|nr:PEP-CTERM sorting domain-containing protein [Verrucomicrobiae bacterium]NNJ41739.1 PEP-CTERM sorting domain-containing protein [Akkermansiaceae bacterium]
MKTFPLCCILSFCGVIYLQAASTFLADPLTWQSTGGTFDTSSFSADKVKLADFEVGTGNSTIEFISQGARGNLNAHVGGRTFITSTVNGNGGTFDLVLRTAASDSDSLAVPTDSGNVGTHLKTYVRHKIISNGDTSSITFTQQFSRAWTPATKWTGLKWGLGQAVDFSGTGQDTSKIAIDVMYYDENLNLIDLTSANFSNDGGNNGYGDAASFSKAGTTATMIYDAAGSAAALNFVDLGDGDTSDDFLGKVVYTIRTTDASNIAEDVAFQYTTNGTVTANSPDLVPEPTALVLLGLGSLSLILRRKR